MSDVTTKRTIRCDWMLPGKNALEADEQCPRTLEYKAGKGGPSAVDSPMNQGWRYGLSKTNGEHSQHFCPDHAGLARANGISR